MLCDDEEQREGLWFHLYLRRYVGGRETAARLRSVMYRSIKVAIGAVRRWDKSWWSDDKVLAARTRHGSAGHGGAGRCNGSVALWHASTADGTARYAYSGGEGMPRRPTEVGHGEGQEVARATPGKSMHARLLAFNRALDAAGTWLASA